MRTLLALHRHCKPLPHNADDQYANTRPASLIYPNRQNAAAAWLRQKSHPK